MAKSVFYYHRCRFDVCDNHADLKQHITKLYHQHKGRYGYRRMTVALSRLGHHHNHKLISRLMRMLGLSAKIRRQKYRSYKGVQGSIAPDHLKRQFHASTPNTRWLTDITEFKVGEDKLYLSPILDCYNHEIVSYTLSKRPTYDLVSKMLDAALAKTTACRDKALLLHSDQGWHYQMKHFSKTLKEHGIKQSMSRKGNCLDNALMEGFFGTLKCETIYIEKPKTIEQLEKQIHEYMHYYNNERIQLKLKGLSPVNYRTQSFI